MLKPIPPNENWRQLLFLYRSYKLVQRLRIAFENTERNFKRDWQKYVDNIGNDPLMLVWNLKKELKPRTIVSATGGREANIWSEAYWEYTMKQGLQNNISYLDFLQSIYGFTTSSILAAGILGMIGPPEKYQGLRSLYHYCGLHVNEQNKAPRLSDYKKGMKRDYNGDLRSLLCENLGTVLIRKKSKYRENYERYIKEEHQKHDWKTCESCQEIYRKYKKKTDKLHPFMRAKRRVVKDFLKDLWNYWIESSHKAQRSNVSHNGYGFPKPHVHNVSQMRYGHGKNSLPKNEER